MRKLNAFINCLFLFLSTAANLFSQTPVNLYTVSNVHSHNDYEQSAPFRMAYTAGFGSMEADIFLTDSGLFVAHDSSELPRRMRMDSAYLIPLLNCVQQNNGYPYADKRKKLQVLIDVKTDSIKTLNVVIDLLNKFPQLIQCKAITWIISGKRPDPSLFTRYPDFIRFDGEFSEGYSKGALSRIALMSGDFRKYSSWRGVGPLPAADSFLLKAIVDSCHRQHIPLRFWDAPDIPDGWQSLMLLQVDYLNTDHIQGMADFLNAKAIVQPGLSELIATEKSFSDYSVSHNTKDAFIRFLDVNGIVFNSQGMAVNGLKVWTAQKRDTFKLKWTPLYAEVDGSGNLGYTTGPWIFNAGAAADSDKSYGAYTSLWIRNTTNQWKLFIDIGVDDSSIAHIADRLYNASNRIKAIKDPIMDTTQLLAADARFNMTFTANMEMAYQNFLSHDHMINIPGHALCRDGPSLAAIIKDTPSGLSLIPLRAILSSQKDLGAVYGEIITGKKKTNYLHIWRNEPGGWKLAVETLVY